MLRFTIATAIPLRSGGTLISTVLSLDVRRRVQDVQYRSRFSSGRAHEGLEQHV